MKYFIIAGEASGDLHAAHLMAALKAKDTEASFLCYGGERMQAVGGKILRHYKDMAYMGFIPVLLHLRTILKVMEECKQAIGNERPDVVILVDYPGFNLKIAKHVHTQLHIPVYYYISPKIWAWKEHRICQIRSYVDEMFSILPFEVDFYEGKHHYPIHYVGNPSVDELSLFKNTYQKDLGIFSAQTGLDSTRPLIVLLPGSRRQEIKDNLAIMAKASLPMGNRGYQCVIAAVPEIETEFYEVHCPGLKEGNFKLLTNKTNELLAYAEAALVTSGTATLETALMNVPQVVCYYAPCGRLVRILKKLFLKVRFISLVNLIVGREVVHELIGDEMNVENLNAHLGRIVKSGSERENMLQGYQEMCRKLGDAGAPQRTAEIMISLLKGEKA